MNEPDPCLPLLLPPRYRLRDLILGDYAFNDDGERMRARTSPGVCCFGAVALVMMMTAPRAYVRRGCICGVAAQEDARGRNSREYRYDGTAVGVSSSGPTWST
ncbi:hypothetical protein PV325_002003 [Microctonus aethiopoides]|nr:hypothetical protein PV325_002003 [Microctonus aethiopoides]